MLTFQQFILSEYLLLSCLLYFILVVKSFGKYNSGLTASVFQQKSNITVIDKSALQNFCLPPLAVRIITEMLSTCI